MLVVPENVTRLAKIELKPNESPLVEERDLLALGKGETLEATLKGTGFAGEDQIRGIVAALGGKTAPPPSSRASRCGCRSPPARVPATGGRSPGSALW